MQQIDDVIAIRNDILQVILTASNKAWRSVISGKNNFYTLKKCNFMRIEILIKISRGLKAFPFWKKQVSCGQGPAATRHNWLIWAKMSVIFDRYLRKPACTFSQGIHLQQLLQ